MRSRNGGRLYARTGGEISSLAPKDVNRLALRRSAVSSVLRSVATLQLMAKESGKGGTNGAPVEASGRDTPAVKKCFVVSEFGADEKTRVERKQTLKHLVKKVLEPMGYEVQRADDIDDLGQITHQIIERLIDDDLVVADLTGLNPNVFYELAVRHAARKPVVTLMTFGQAIPFDLKDVRTVFYDLHDPDKLEAAQAELAQKVRAIEENPADVRNPITVARNVSLLQQSDDPDARAAGTVLEAVNDLRDELRALGRRVAATAPPPLALDVARERIMAIIASGGQHTTEEVANLAETPLRWTEQALRLLASRADPQVYSVDGKWSDIPF
jgi:hypothetical protein